MLRERTQTAATGAIQRAGRASVAGGRSLCLGLSTIIYAGCGGASTASSEVGNAEAPRLTPQPIAAQSVMEEQDLPANRVDAVVDRNTVCQIVSQVRVDCRNDEIAKVELTRDGKDAGLVYGRDETWQVYHAGQVSPVFASIVPSSLALSESGTYASFIARHQGELSVVHDGPQSTLYYSCQDPGKPIVSPNGQHVAFADRRDAGWVMVVNGYETSIASESESVLSEETKLADNGRWAAVIEMDDGQFRVVTDRADQFIETCDAVSWQRFDPSGEHFAVAISVDGSERVMLDGRLHPRFKFVSIFWSGRWLANGDLLYVAHEEHDSVLMRNGEEIDRRDWLGSLRLAPDGESFVYQVREDGKTSWVVDGRENQWWDAVFDTAISYGPDGDVVFVAKRGGQWFLVSKAGEQVMFDGARVVTSLMAREDGKAACIWVDDAGRQHVLDTAGRSWTSDREGMSIVRFSPSGLHFHAPTWKRGAIGYLVNGYDTPVFEKLSSVDVQYSPDEQHFCFYAQHFDNVRLCIDDHEIAVVDRLLSDGLSFSNNETCEFVALQDGKIVQFQVTLPTAPYMPLIDGFAANEGKSDLTTEAVAALQLGIGTLSFGEIADVILDDSFDLNAMSEQGRTPLFEAARWGRWDVVKLMLVSGADPNHCNSDGQTPLHAALAGGDARTALILLRHGADPNARDGYDRQPIDLVPTRILTNRPNAELLEICEHAIRVEIEVQLNLVEDIVTELNRRRAVASLLESYNLNFEYDASTLLAGVYGTIPERGLSSQSVEMQYMGVDLDSRPSARLNAMQNLVPKANYTPRWAPWALDAGDLSNLHESRPMDQRDMKLSEELESLIGELVANAFVLHAGDTAAIEELAQRVQQTLSIR